MFILYQYSVRPIQLSYWCKLIRMGFIYQDGSLFYVMHESDNGRLFQHPYILKHLWFTRKIHRQMYKFTVIFGIYTVKLSSSVETSYSVLHMFFEVFLLIIESHDERKALRKG